METKIIEPAFRLIPFNISVNGRRINRSVDKADVFALLRDSRPGLPIRVEIRQYKVGGCSTKHTQPMVEDPFQDRSWSTSTSTAVDECVFTGAQWQLRYQEVAGLGCGRRLTAGPDCVPHVVE